MEQDLKNRLVEVIEYFKLTPSMLADEISINRSRLSHILNGRNNPTLEVIQGILLKYNDLNPDWLLFGQGNMIRSGIEQTPKDLFQFAELNKKKKQQITETISESVISKESNDLSTEKEDIRPEIGYTGKIEGLSRSKIKRITVYFSDNEYKDFIESSS
jgi:hypothetical protein